VLCVSKLVAYREKDFGFAVAMLESGLIDPRILAGRMDLLFASLDSRAQPRLQGPRYERSGSSEALSPWEWGSCFGLV
jgi:hypothetical protein